MLFGVLFVRADSCAYWVAKIDPRAAQVDYDVDETDQSKILEGIKCLLKQEHRTGQGVLYGSKPFVSQIVPKASVDINALYQISRLFYGNDDFAQAVALTSNPPKLIGEYDNIEFNSKDVVAKAFASYRKWFKKVKKLGLDGARKQKINPLDGSGVSWY